MVPIEQIPTEELLRDRADSVQDATICEMVFPPQERCTERLRINRAVIEKIDAELERRRQEGNVPPAPPYDFAMECRYRKKPVVVTAFQTHVPLEIQTLEGAMRADPGDWIITGIKGEKYPCKDDIFRATYEPVQEETNE